MPLHVRTNHCSSRVPLLPEATIPTLMMDTPHLAGSSALIRPSHASCRDWAALTGVAITRSNKNCRNVLVKNFMKQPGRQRKQAMHRMITCLNQIISSAAMRAMSSQTFVLFIPEHRLPKLDLVSIRIHDPCELAVLVRFRPADDSDTGRLKL